MQVGFFDIIARYDFFDVAIEGQERWGRESDFFEIFGTKVEKTFRYGGEFYPVVFEKNGIGRPEISAVQIEIIQFRFVSAIQDGNIVERGG